MGGGRAVSCLRPTVAARLARIVGCGAPAHRQCGARAPVHERRRRRTPSDTRQERRAKTAQLLSLVSPDTPMTTDELKAAGIDLVEMPLGPMIRYGYLKRKGGGSYRVPGVIYYAISGRTRCSANLLLQDREPSHQILEMREIEVDLRISQALGLQPVRSRSAPTR